MKTKNQEFLEELNQAFARSDTDFIADHVTDTIRWQIVGDQTIEGKKAFTRALKEMETEKPMELTIHHIITHGKEASVNGIMKIPGEDKAFAFCDVYKFSGFKNPQITEMLSYVIETTG
ncbi:nuclear transport factor 2 family protein [Aliifodinibius salicampi]|uniref:Nuclear transport factor 2 family protein n=1 Tax=Fodinibius salicampi TaxID=1920655 RepID=A0ABT3PXA3_9BACT|nr:nuclear transport factor 2 family protein [Fodinibius salicampi]MCW9712510.1 nuclear transport factor 2 family protein [Fodinibius salicampi]